MYETSIERLKRDIENIARFTATPGEGRTSFSYSDKDAKVRQYIKEQFDSLGLKVSVDGVGNIRARLEGTEREALPVMAGSHVDSVFQGGNYDGVVGVAGALEVARVIVENKIKLKNPFEIVVFSEEEGSNFGSCCQGSKVLVGNLEIEDIKGLKNDKGISMYEMARNAGFHPDSMKRFLLKPGDLKAMLEIHIEQSSVLENQGVSLGIVEAIAGLKQFSVVVEGVPNHAGATPMSLRHDPLVAASIMIAELEVITSEKALPTTVGTVGKIVCEPNVSNVIPGKVSFTMDIRDVDEKGIDMTVSQIKKRIFEIAEHYGVEVSLDLLGEQDVVRLSEKMADTLEEVAKERDLDYMRMNSGAVHDAVLLVPVTEVGLIFVPSWHGRSHVAAEYTEMEDIKKGCDLLLGTILRLAS